MSPNALWLAKKMVWSGRIDPRPSPATVTVLPATPRSCATPPMTTGLASVEESSTEMPWLPLRTISLDDTSVPCEPLTMLMPLPASSPTPFPAIRLSMIRIFSLPSIITPPRNSGGTRLGGSNVRPLATISFWKMRIESSPSSTVTPCTRTPCEALNWIVFATISVPA